MPKRVRPPLARNIKVIAAAMRGAPTVYTIDGIRGLHLAVHGGGRATWRLRYQPAPGQNQRWLTLGDARTLDLPPVFERAQRMMAELRLDGIDPRAGRKPAKATPTVDKLFADWLDHPGRRRALRPRTREYYVALFQRHIAPRIGITAITKLDTGAIESAVEDIRIASTRLDRNHRGTQATKALKLIRSLCEYAVSRGFIERNPTRGIRPPVPVQNPEGRQHRPPTDDELRRLWHAAPQRMSPQAARIVRLAFLLGKRLSEIVDAEQSEVHLGRNAHWFIPGSRMGNKSREDEIVPLPPLAARILAEAMADSGVGRFVFQARRLTDMPISRHTPSQAFLDLRRQVGITDRVRFHDARGLINDQLAKLRVPREYRSHVLHHTGDMRATLADANYSTYDYLDEKRRALRLWSLRLQEIVRGRRPRGLRW